MLLIRVVLCSAVSLGAAFAAGPQLGDTVGAVAQLVPQKASSNALPPAMTSAIGRLTKPGAPKLPAMPGADRKWFAFGQTPHVMIAQAPGLSRQCSIPLAESKPPANSPKFLIGQVPVGKKSPDAMPVLRSPVCPAH
ncbi:MAG TPA: hypothetical protein VFA65_08960 [Bryobacteraceae bacterium]|nr:hypothetical protein [Bryobacteraceae bacterium]